MNTMTNIVAKPHGVLFSFFTFFYFSYHFFSLLLKTPIDPYFHWNSIIDRKHIPIFPMENRVSAKNKKEEEQHIVNPYLNLFVRRCI